MTKAHETPPPFGLASTDGLGLVPCALCGEDKGYTLDEGSTYRWWSVKCAACGQEVAEARSNYPAETTPRTTRADDAWNDAGAHAAGLRDEIAHMRAALAAYFALADASWRETCEHAAKRGITSIPIGPAHAAAMDKFNELRALYGPNV